MTEEERVIYSKVYYLDNYVPSTLYVGITNEPIRIHGTAVQGWQAPSFERNALGKHYVLFDDGTVYEREDSYVLDSPYGWRVSTYRLKPPRSPE